MVTSRSTGSQHTNSFPRTLQPLASPWSTRYMEQACICPSTIKRSQNWGRRRKTCSSLPKNELIHWYRKLVMWSEKIHHISKLISYRLSELMRLSTFTLSFGFTSLRSISFTFSSFLKRSNLSGPYVEGICQTQGNVYLKDMQHLEERYANHSDVTYQWWNISFDSS